MQALRLFRSVVGDTKVLQHRPFAVKNRSETWRQTGSVVGRHSGRTVQFIEQRLGVLQVGGVEALGKPLVDVGEYRARLGAAASAGEQAREG